MFENSNHTTNPYNYWKLIRIHYLQNVMQMRFFLHFLNGQIVLFFFKYQNLYKKEKQTIETKLSMQQIIFFGSRCLCPPPWHYSTG